MSKDFYVEDFVLMAIEEGVVLCEANENFLMKLINDILKKFGWTDSFVKFQGLYPDLLNLLNNTYVLQRHMIFDEMINFFRSKNIDDVYIFFNMNDSKRIFYVKNISELSIVLKRSYRFDFYVCNENLTLFYAWNHFETFTEVSCPNAVRKSNKSKGSDSIDSKSLIEKE